MAYIALYYGTARDPNEYRLDITGEKHVTERPVLAIYSSLTVGEIKCALRAKKFSSNQLSENISEARGFLWQILEQIHKEDEYFFDLNNRAKWFKSKKLKTVKEELLVTRTHCYGGGGYPTAVIKEVEEDSIPWYYWRKELSPRTQELLDRYTWEEIRDEILYLVDNIREKK